MSKLVSFAFVSCSVLALCALGHAYGPFPEFQGAPVEAKPLSPLAQVKLDEGVWDATVSVVMNPASPPAVMKGTQTNTMACDGKWLIEHFKGDEFEGHGIVGWDPQKKKYVSVWVDAESPSLQIGEGTCSADGKTRTMLVDAADEKGKMLKTREEHIVDGPDSRTLKIYGDGADDKASPLITIEYKRHAGR